jgi:DNA-binding transcriptional regulator YdaS (Cro superfamily)
MKILAEFVERGKRGLIKATRLYGSTQNLAKKIGISKQYLNYWKTKNSLIPYEIAVKIFVVTEGQVSINELRPDLRNMTKKLAETFLKQACSLCLANKKIKVADPILKHN